MSMNYKKVALIVRCEKENTIVNFVGIVSSSLEAVFLF